MLKRRNDSGFTLMEVLIAIAILGIVMAIVYGSFVQTRRVIARAEGAVDELRGIRVAFIRMAWDISMAFRSDNNEGTFFVGTDNYSGGYPDDSIDFTTYANQRRVRDVRESDQMEVGYYLRRGFGIITSPLEEEGQGEEEAVLMKREKKRIDTNPMYGGKTYELSENIAGLNFRYLDQGAWLDSWDSRVTNTIPEAVEITITVKESRGVERSYRTVAAIPMGKRS